MVEEILSSQSVFLVLTMASFHWNNNTLGEVFIGLEILELRAHFFCAVCLSFFLMAEFGTIMKIFFSGFIIVLNLSERWGLFFFIVHVFLVF